MGQNDTFEPVWWGRTGVVELMTMGGFVFWARWPVPLSKWSNDVIKIHERLLY